MNSAAAGVTPVGEAGIVERLRSHAASVGLVVMLAAGAVLYYVAGRGTSFFFDEWTFILQRRANDVDAFLSPHNGHLSLVPVATYKVLWSTVGLRHYGPYRLVDIALHLTCVSLLFVLVRRRVGAPAGFLAATSLLLLGRAWQDLVWPFQMGYLGSLAAGLGMLIALERDDRLGDLLAAVLLGLSLACSGLGLPFAIGALTTLLLSRSGWRRYLLVAAPMALYAVWFAFYSESEARGSNIPAVPGYVTDSFASAVGALGGMGIGAGKWLALPAIGVLAFVALRGGSVRRAATPAAIALSFWIATALARAQFHEPDASRYLYPGALLLLLVAAELGGGAKPGPIVVGVLAVLVVGAAFLNLRELRAGAGGLRMTSAIVDAELGIVELESAVVAPDFGPDPARAPQLTASSYLAAVADLGSPALPVTELPAQDSLVRAEADSVLVRAVASALVSPGTGPAGSTPPAVEGYEGGTLVPRDGCHFFRPGSTPVPPSFDLVLPRRGVVIRTPGAAALFLRRFADDYPETASVQTQPGSSLIRPPRDASPARWHLRIAPSRPVLACGTR